MKKLNKKAKIITISCFSVVAVISIAVAIILINKIDIPLLNIRFNKQNEIKEVSFKDNVSVNSEDEINIKSLFNNSELLSDNLEVSFENADETLSDRTLKTRKIFQNENKEEITENDYNTLENKESITIKEIYYSIGKYNLIVKDITNDKEYTNKLTINDNTNPELLLKEVSITDGESININSFIESCIDNSKEECKLSFMDENNNEIESVDTSIGERDVKIQATDSSLNKTIQTTKLKVNEKSKTTTSNTTKKNTNSNTKNNSNNNSNTNTTSAPAPKTTPICAKSNLKLLNKQLGNPYMLHDLGENWTKPNVTEIALGTGDMAFIAAWERKMPWGPTGMDFAQATTDYIDDLIEISTGSGAKYARESYTWGNAEIATAYCGSLTSNIVRGSYWTGFALAYGDNEYLKSKGVKHGQHIAYVYLKENYKVDINILVDWLKPYAVCTKNCDLLAFVHGIKY